MSIDFLNLGYRLRAYRIGAALSAEQVADNLQISRAAVYRMEKGEIVKIETLERLTKLLNVSFSSLLGVEVEYYSNALGYFERMRQLERDSVRIVSYFQPVSFLLMSSAYGKYVRQMLIEAIPTHTLEAEQIDTIDRVVDILNERKAYYERRRQPIVSLIGLRELERFMHIGLVGRLDLPAEVRSERLQAARLEVERIASLIEKEPIGIQIGIVDDNMPGVTFQIFHSHDRSHVSVSPFRLGELPNIRTGIATVTSSSDAVNLYENMVEQLWRRAYKGANGAKAIKDLLERVTVS